MTRPHSCKLEDLMCSMMVVNTGQGKPSPYKMRSVFVETTACPQVGTICYVLVGVPRSLIPYVDSYGANMTRPEDRFRQTA